MKKILNYCFLIMTTLVLFSCSNANIDAVKLSKNFYKEYLKTNENADRKVDKVKQKYMTPLLIEELELRAMQMEADSITGVQDSYGMLDIMDVNTASEDDTAIVTFSFKNEEGSITKIIETRLHYKKYNNKILMDSLDMVINDYDNNTDSMREYLTKYANKESLSEEDEKEMSDIRKHYEELYQEGYIG